MFKRIDESPLLVRLLARVSNFLARRKGLPMVVGILLIIVAMIIELLNISLGSPVLQVIHIVLHYGGLLLALIGFLLAEPLGK
jgi:hypothetical protein